MPLKQHQHEVLTSMVALLECGRAEVRPKDVGGVNRSHHAQTLRDLTRHGLVEQVRDPATAHFRAAFLYRLTEAGRRALAETSNLPAFDRLTILPVRAVGGR